MKHRFLLLAVALLVAACDGKYTPPAPAPPPPPLSPEQGKPDNGGEGGGEALETPFKDVTLTSAFQEDFSEAASFLRFSPKANGGEDFRYYSAHPSLSEKNATVMMMRIDPTDAEGWGKGPQVITKDYTFYGSYSARIRVPDIRKAQKNIGAAAGLYVHDADEKFGLSAIDMEIRIADPTKIHLAAWTGKKDAPNWISRTIDLAKGTVIECSYGTGTTETGRLTDAQNIPASIPSISGFDASGQFYIYGFDWYPDRLTWWIRLNENSDKVILWEYEGTELFPDTYAPAGIPVLPAHNLTSFWHSSTRLAEGMSKATEAPKYPFEMEIDWMAYKPFDL
ncbi:MAG: glycoside hydrolase family 16 protein [Bacteroidales bacterium]|nr:glycoside hydrolase family 16 protein [Bacteroidales bacterium]